MRKTILSLLIFCGTLICGCQKSVPEAELILAYEGYSENGEAELIRLANVGKFKRQDSLRILYRQFRVKKREILAQIENDTTEEAMRLRGALDGEYKGTELEDDYNLIESYKFDRDGVIGYKYSAEFKIPGRDSLEKSTYLLNESRTRVIGKLKTL